MKKLSLLLLMALFAMTASAYTYYNNVEIGNFKYSYLALGSSSSEENYAFMSGLSSTASSSLTTLDIPGYVVYNGNHFRVKQINQDAFHNNTKITSVTFGYGVENISSYVFDGCTNLKYVNLPSSVKEIGQFVFQNCTSLYVVAFAGEKAPKIYDYTFNLSSSTKRASTATYRGMNALKADAKWVAAFGASNILRHYSYKVGDFKVYNSTNGCWQYYTIKNGIPYNGNSSNPSLRSMCMLVAATFTDGSNNTISLPQSVGNSDNNAPGGYKFYGVADSAFMGNTAITKITNNSTFANKIGIRAFYGCSNIVSADVPVDTIGNFAFYGCTKLISATITSNLNNTSYIGSFAFGSTLLTGEMNIPATVKYIGTAPFYNCILLTKITVDENNTNYSSYNSILYNKAQTELIQIPGSWYNMNYQNDYNVYLPETLQRVLQYAAAGCKMENLYLFYGVKQIDQYAFRNCTNLKKVHLPSSLTNVSSTAFDGCTSINRVELNYMTPPATDFFPAVTNKSNVKLYMPYGSYSAYANSSIWSQYNRQTGTYDHLNSWDINYVDDRLYYSVTPTPYMYNGRQVDGTLKVVRVWTNLSSNNSVYIREILNYGGKRYVPTVIGAYAGSLAEQSFHFNGHTGNITDIEENAFRDSKIVYWTFRNVEHIGDYAFYNTSFMDYIIVDRAKTIGDCAFASSKIARFMGSTALTSIGSFAFYNCSNLHEIFLPQSSQNSLTCGNLFFGNNASDFKCYVDYRWLGSYINSNKWDRTKIYPHLKLDSKYQSFACIKPINFEGTDVGTFYVAEYDQSEKTAYLAKPNNFKLAANNGAIVTGEVGEYYRLDYADSGTTTNWMVAVTSSPQTVNSNSTTSYFKVNPDEMVFDKITSNTTFDLGSAYLKIPTNQTGGATTIITNFGGTAVVDVPGDVNGDGIVSSVDVTAIYNYLLNNDSSAIVNGDQDNDGSITAGDIVIIYNILLGQ